MSESVKKANLLELAPSEPAHPASHPTHIQDSKISPNDHPVPAALSGDNHRADVAAPRPSVKETILDWFKQGIPTLAVVSVLIGLAILGHHTDWSLKNIYKMIGWDKEEVDDWCPEHFVKESSCFECSKYYKIGSQTVAELSREGVPQDVLEKLSPMKFKSFQTEKGFRQRLNKVLEHDMDKYGELIVAKAKGSRAGNIKPPQFCEIHGVHGCPFENLAVVQLPQPASISPDEAQRAKEAIDLKQRVQNNPHCKYAGRCVQFASDKAMKAMGIEVEQVKRQDMDEVIPAPGQITYADPSRGTEDSLVAGRVWKITKKGRLGAQVKKGDLLAVIDSVEVGNAKSELLQALAQLELKTLEVERLRPLSGVTVSQATFLVAEAAAKEAAIRLAGAEQRLANLGLAVDTDSLKKLSLDERREHLRLLGLYSFADQIPESKQATSNLFPVRASRDGVVTEVKVREGVGVEAYKTLFEVTDKSKMWLVLNVRSEDRKYLRLADANNPNPMKVRFYPDGEGDDIVEADLTWISESADEKTRTVQVRADLTNTERAYKAHTFGRGQIVLRRAENTIVVPNEAIHWEGCCHVVFVRDKDFYKYKDDPKKDAEHPKLFHARSVRLGARNATHTEILAGVRPDEWVATTNSAILCQGLIRVKPSEDADFEQEQAITN